MPKLTKFLTALFIGLCIVFGIITCTMYLTGNREMAIKMAKMAGFNILMAIGLGFVPAICWLADKFENYGE